jgi:hypothetical protein
MKKYLPLVFLTLSLLAPVCFAQSGMGESAKPKMNKAASASLFEESLIAKEKEVWEAFKRKDANALKGLLAEGAYEIDDEGELSTKAHQISTLADLSLTEYMMEEIKVVPINKDAAIVRYKVMIKGSYKGKEFDPKWSFASAVWVNRSGNWQNLLYQETPIKRN